MTKTLFTIFMLLLLASCAWDNDIHFQDSSAPSPEELTKSEEQTFDFGPQKIEKKIEQNVKKTAQKKSVKKTLKRNIAQKKLAPTKKQEQAKKVESTPQKLVIEKKVEPAWKGEEVVLEVTYLGILAGRMGIKSMQDATVGGREAYHIRAILESAPYFKYIYTLKDFADTYISKESFAPLKFSFIQRESKKDVDQKMLFDPDKKKYYFWYKRNKKGKITTKYDEGKVPKGLQDPFSTLYYVRGLKLAKGKKFVFPVMIKGKVWETTLKVLGKEEIFVLDKTFKTIKIEVVGVDRTRKNKRSSAVIWLTDDEQRAMIQFEAQLKFGAISGELVSYKRGRGLASQ